MASTDEDYAYDEWMSDLYKEHKAEALSELTGERLRLYFLSDRNIAQPVFAALTEAQALHRGGFLSASFMFAHIAIEVSLKTLLLKPIVNSLVHDIATSTLIGNLVIQQNAAMDRFRDLLLTALCQLTKIDLKTFRRTALGQGLWEEIASMQVPRNQLVHRAKMVNQQEADTAIAIAGVILGHIFPETLKAAGLHAHDAGRICDDWTCQYEGEVNAEMLEKWRGIRKGD